MAIGIGNITMSSAVAREMAVKPQAVRRRRNRIYSSSRILANADSAGAVDVQLTLDDVTLKAIMAEVNARSLKGNGSSHAKKERLERTLEAISDGLKEGLSAELDKVIQSYRAYLREALVRPEDSPLKAALNQARLQERILAGATMADQAEACRLLGLSDANPSATMKRRETELLRFSVDGKVAYPLLQFDVENRRIFPGMARLLALSPSGWSGFRLLYWLTRPHLDFETTPAAALASDEASVVAAFEREIAPQVHG